LAYYDTSALFVTFIYQFLKELMLSCKRFFKKKLLVWLSIEQRKKKKTFSLFNNSYLARKLGVIFSPLFSFPFGLQLISVCFCVS